MTRFLFLFALLTNMPVWAQQTGSCDKGADNYLHCVGPTDNARVDSHAASPTDGTEPDYDVVPVTQKIPHCKAGQVLKQFDKSNYGTLSTDEEYLSWRLAQHDNRWVDPSPKPSDTVVLAGPIYRCFDKPGVATAAHFESDSRSGQLCAGDCMLSDFHPADTGMGKCGMDEHWHDPAVMWPVNPSPKAHQGFGILTAMATSGDGLCHRDKDDSVVDHSANPSLPPYDHQGTEFPAKPSLGQLYHSSKGADYQWMDGSWKLIILPKPFSNSCPSTQHLHPRGMNITQPDVKGAPRPIADNRCHDDHTDEPSAVLKAAPHR